MNQQIVDYLKENKGGYTKESLITQLRNSGHDEAEIMESINEVYKVTEIPLPDSGKINGNNIKYAGFWIRFLAFFIDSIIVGAVVGLVNIIAISLLSNNGSNIFLQIISFLLVLTYYIAMTNQYQATLGKMAVGIKVCSINSLGKAELNSILIRETISRLTATFLTILYLVVAFKENKQGLHDMVAKTVVIYKKQ
ncbi:MAG: RDD family protein [Candidatus Moraniibacteriota bacterium]|jgi:uncharacterized RDD family membrane protein YckC